MVKLYDAIKWQNVQKLCINTLALPYTTSNEKCFSVYVTYLNLFKDHFGGGIWVYPQPAVNFLHFEEPPSSHQNIRSSLPRNAKDSDDAPV